MTKSKKGKVKKGVAAPGAARGGPDARFAEQQEEQQQEHENEEEEQQQQQLELERDDEADAAEEGAGGAASQEEEDGGDAGARSGRDRRFALPSQEEQEQMRHAGSLFRNNLLKLELDALLGHSRVALSEEQQGSLRELLVQTKALLEGLGTREGVTAKSLKLHLDSWSSGAGASPSLRFVAPSKVAVVGSYLLGSLAKAGRCVDVAVTMPGECFDKKDYLSHRYSEKRALYLGVLGRALGKRTDLFEAVQFAPWLCDASKPVLLLRPAHASLRRLTVRVLPVLTADVFPASRFRPDQSNVRAQGRLAEAEDAGASQQLWPTPHYNMALLEDVEGSSCAEHLAVLHECTTVCPAFADASVLLKVWARVHGLGKEACADTFHEGLQVFLLAWMVQDKRLSHGFSAQQMFKAVMAFLAQTDLSKGPVLRMRPSLKQAPVSEAGFEDAALSKVFPVVLLGPCGRLVLSWRVSPSGWRAVQVQALSTHRILEDAAGQRGGKDAFAAVFTSKADPWQQFDKHFCVRFPARAPHAGLPKGGCQLLCDRSWEAAVRHRAEQVFRGAFVETGRASELRLVGLAAGQPWALDAAPPAAPLLVCMQLDVNNAFRALDKGPAAEDTPAAARFRAFWGAKAELRRFQDGSILETLDWTEEARRGADLCEVVAAHALAQHWPFQDAGAVGAAGSAVGTQLGRALAELDAQEQARTHTAVASPELAFKALLSAFDRLSSRLRKLQLPLGVRGVAPADAALRYASVALPRAHPLAFGPEDGARHAVLRAAAAEAEAAIQQQHQGRKRRREEGEVGAVSRLVDAVDVVLQIEASGQWPDDAEAIARTKTAFYVQLAETLDKTHKGAQRCVAARDCVEVLMEGFAFRLVLRVDRERAVMLTPRKSFMGSVSTVAARQLLDNEAGETGEAGQQQQQQQQRLQKHQDADQAALVARARALERETVRLPLLHLHLHALHTSSDRSGGAHILGPATRLAKLWVAGQCLAPHLRDEAVELLVACVFLHPQPYAAPRSAQSAFLRFLHLLARWDWANEPLKVQLGPEPFTVDVAARFLDLRERGLGAPMYLVTPDDSDAEPYWTDKQHPSAEALKLIMATAADSLALFERMLSAQAAGQYDAQQMDWLWLAAFSAATEQWDVVLHLRPESTLAAPREHRARLYKNLATQEKLLVGCRPLLLFGDALERRFGHLFQVLLDPLRGNKIGLKLLPDSMRPTPLRVATAAHAKPDPGKPGHVVPNLAEILAEVVALGEGIVSSVEIAQEELQQ